MPKSLCSALLLAVSCFTRLPPAPRQWAMTACTRKTGSAITFRDIAEDIAAAKDEGKRLAIIFEQRGCIYCAKMHEVILADPEVVGLSSRPTSRWCSTTCSATRKSPTSTAKR